MALLSTAGMQRLSMRVFSERLSCPGSSFSSVSPSQPEGYKVKLLARRLDSPGDQWHEAEHIVHIAGRNRWANLAIVSGSTALGVWLSTTSPDDLSPSSRDRLIGASLGAGVGLLATKITW